MRKRKISKRVTDQKLHLQMKDRFEEIRTRENWNASVTEWTNAVSNLKNLVKREKRKGERSSKGATIVLFSQRFILELFVTLILSFSPSHLLPFESVEKEQFSNEWGWIPKELSDQKKSRLPPDTTATLSDTDTHRLCILLCYYIGRHVWHANVNHTCEGASFYAAFFHQILQRSVTIASIA